MFSSNPNSCIKLPETVVKYIANCIELLYVDNIFAIFQVITHVHYCSIALNKKDDCLIKKNGKLLIFFEPIAN